MGHGIQSQLMSGLSGLKTQFQGIWTDLQSITKAAVSNMSEEVQQGFSGMKNAIGELSQQTSSLGSSIRSLGDTFNSDFLKNVGSGINKIGNTVNDVMGIVDKLGSMKNTIGNLGDTMKNLGNVLESESGGGLLSNIGSFLSKIGNADGGQIVSKFGNLISGLTSKMGGLGEGISGVLSKLGSLGSSGGGILSNLGSLATSVISKLGGVGLGIKALWDNCDSFRDGVTNIWNGIKNTFANGLNAIKKGISNAAYFVGNIASSIWGGIKNVASSAWNWGKDIVSGIAGGIKKGVSWVGNAVKSVANGIRSFLHFSVPDEGPLADADTYMLDFMNLLTSGVKKGEGSLIDQIRSMAAKVQQGMDGISSFTLPELTLPQLMTPVGTFRRRLLPVAEPRKPQTLAVCISRSPALTLATMTNWHRLWQIRSME